MKVPARFIGAKLEAALVIIVVASIWAIVVAVVIGRSDAAEVLR
jgi:type III secretory pathway component EscS